MTECTLGLKVSSGPDEQVGGSEVQPLGGVGSQGVGPARPGAAVAGVTRAVLRSRALVQPWLRGTQFAVQGSGAAGQKPLDEEQDLEDQAPMAGVPMNLLGASGDSLLWGAGVGSACC